ncbi:hypothetical protein [Nocardia caishijiensis]|uniref:Uncharacterized protein n=1 Tax=Nocardia caishijiensis TaxID=184756 RepID=A0ABQ6YHK2_9NOCA|nr:hypothetical protein [Nocardia caishijiensis]KAF0845272.1 hypothetical protein FNL39_10880 [Nocardia caishijiensis]
MSRNELVHAWFVAAAAPKPRKKEFIDELKGWSGVLGGAREWVRDRYGALAAFLAGTDTSVDEPDGWLAVSRLYADYADPLARFSAQFAAIAHSHRPRGVPNKISERVKSFELAVPPGVRKVMAGERLDSGIGGVVDSVVDADHFVARPSAYHDRYLPIALRRYASILLDKRADFVADHRLCAAFDEAIAALAIHGDPDLPARPPSPSETRRVEDLLAVGIGADPAVRDDPRFAQAYLRARATMLRWAVDGRALTDATILYSKLRSVRLDDARARNRTAQREVSVAEPAVPERKTEPVEIGRVLDRDILTRAAGELEAVAESCWERDLAADLLSGGAGRVPFDDLRTRVLAEWRAAGARPVGASARNPSTATRIVDAMLFMAVTAVIGNDDLAEFVEAPTVHGIGARFDEASAVLDELRTGEQRGSTSW